MVYPYAYLFYIYLDFYFPAYNKTCLLHCLKAQYLKCLLNIQCYTEYTKPICCLPY